MPDIHKHLTINASPDWVWAALTDATTMSIWMQSNTVAVDLRVGGSYSIFNGQITGKFIHINPYSLLEYSWRQENWQPNWEDSLVRWELHEEGKNTRLYLIHTRLPNTLERDSHEGGWEMYWLAPMKDWLENG